MKQFLLGFAEGYFIVSVIIYIFLFLMNMFILEILTTLGFHQTMSEKSYLVSPLFSIIVLYMIDQGIRKKKKSL